MIVSSVRFRCIYNISKVNPMDPAVVVIRSGVQIIRFGLSLIVGHSQYMYGCAANRDGCVCSRGCSRAMTTETMR